MSEQLSLFRERFSLLHYLDMVRVLPDGDDKDKLRRNPMHSLRIRPEMVLRLKKDKKDELEIIYFVLCRQRSILVELNATQLEALRRLYASNGRGLWKVTEKKDRVEFRLGYKIAERSGVQHGN